jgi:hypothetical protein
MATSKIDWNRLRQRIAALGRWVAGLGRQVAPLGRKVAALGRRAAPLARRLGPLGRWLAALAARAFRAARHEASKDKYREYLSSAYSQMRQRYPAVESTAKEALDAIGVRPTGPPKTKRAAPSPSGTKKKTTVAAKTTRKKAPARKKVVRKKAIVRKTTGTRKKAA